MVSAVEPCSLWGEGQQPWWWWWSFLMAPPHPVGRAGYTRSITNRKAEPVLRGMGGGGVRK